jgi:hypothetical protein
LMAGQHPFAGVTPLDVFEAIECRPVAATASLREGVPKEVDEIILQMLERRLEARPSANEVCKVFERALKYVDPASF